MWFTYAILKLRLKVKVTKSAYLYGQGFGSYVDNKISRRVQVSATQGVRGPNSDDFQNLVRTFLSKETSMVEVFHEDRISSFFTRGR